MTKAILSAAMSAGRLNSFSYFLKTTFKRRPTLSEDNALSESA
jgi:hypothetical protein